MQLTLLFNKSARNCESKAIDTPFSFVYCLLPALDLKVTCISERHSVETVCFITEQWRGVQETMLN